MTKWLCLALLLLAAPVHANLVVGDVVLTWTQPAPEGFTGIMEFWAGSVNYGTVPWLITGESHPDSWYFWIGSDLSGLENFTIAGMDFAASIQPDGHVLGTMHVNSPAIDPPAPPVGVPEPHPWLLMAMGAVGLAWWWRHA